MELFTLTNTGLILDIVGAIIIFFYGLPSAETKTIHAIAFQDSTKKELRQVKISKILSPAGILLLVCGFAFQLIGNII